MLDKAKRAGICIAIASALVWSVGALSAREGRDSESAAVGVPPAAVALASARPVSAQAGGTACAGQTWPNISAECLAVGSGQPGRPVPRRIAIGGQ